MMTTMAFKPSALKNPFSWAITKGREVLPVRVVRPSVRRSCAPALRMKNRNKKQSRRIQRPSEYIFLAPFPAANLNIFISALSFLEGRHLRQLVEQRGVDEVLRLRLLGLGL